MTANGILEKESIWYLTSILNTTVARPVPTEGCLEALGKHTASHLRKRTDRQESLTDQNVASHRINLERNIDNMSMGQICSALLSLLHCSMARRFVIL